MNQPVKLAAADQDFEQAFFSLSFEKLQSKLYNLLPYFVGFELVKKSEDNNKAVGVFAFKSDNGQVLFVPCFFINGKVKELDTLYSKNYNQFYPLTEDYAELFLKDDTTGLGSVSENRRQDVLKDMPAVDFRDMVIPPRTGRQVMASVIDYVEESDNQVKQAFWNLMESNADFVGAVTRFYDKSEISRALTPHDEPTEKIASKASKVDVIRLSESKTPKELPERNKADLVSRGYTIIDRRKDKEKSQFGVVDIAAKFTNPQESGFYSYVTEMGTLRYGLVLIRPWQLHQGFSTQDNIILDLEAKTPGRAYITDSPIFIKDQVHVKDYSAIHKLMEDPVEALPSFSNSYILINDKLKCTIPFRVTQNFKDDFGVRRLMVEPDNSLGEHDSCSSPRSKAKSNSYFNEKSPREVTLIFTKKEGDTLNYRGTTVYIPKGFKLLQIKTSMYDYGVPYDPTDPEGVERKRQKEKARIKEGKPGDLNDVTALLREKNVVPMTLHTNGSEYFVNVSEVKKKYPNPIEAKIGMVLDLGLDEQAGDQLVDNLLPGLPVNGMFKFAVTGEQFLQLLDEMPQSDEQGNLIHYGIPYQQQVDRSDGYTGNPTQYGLATKPEVRGIDAEVNSAVQMANSGQKEIFDTQAIATLAKYVDPTNKVLSYIPSFVTSLDKLGRMLFMIYWETDKFQKMYGEDELPELIELLKSVFKNLGDLVIFLKRKFPDISINTNEQGIDQI